MDSISERLRREHDLSAVHEGRPKSTLQYVEAAALRRVERAEVCGAEILWNPANAKTHELGGAGAP